MKKYLHTALIALAVLTGFGAVALIGPEQMAEVAVYESTAALPTVIIDPGHGGDDGGAVSPGGVLESDVNLQISLKLRDIFLLCGILPEMTRSTETIDYPEGVTSAKARKTYDQEARLAQINQVENAFLISIHQNKYTGAQPFGSQVFYAPTEESQEFAQRLQSIFIDTINPENYRSATQISQDIYLMNHVNCPAVLIECGFLSNPEEEALLQTPEYQRKLAAAIAACYLDSTDLFGGTNEREDHVFLYGMRQ